MGSLLGDLVAWLLGRGTTMGLTWLVRTTIEGTAQVLSDNPDQQHTQYDEQQIEQARRQEAIIHAEIDDMQRLTKD